MQMDEINRARCYFSTLGGILTFGAAMGYSSGKNNSSLKTPPDGTQKEKKTKLMLLINIHWRNQYLKIIS